MYLSGIADEAADDVDGQIRATLALGWRHIEARNIDGQNLHDLSDAKFDEFCGKLSDAGVRVNCFAAAIANWGKQITEPFDSSLAEARRAIPRMQRLGTQFVRIMSFAVLRGRAPDDQMAEERFRRLRELVALFTDAGLTAVHENCMNYGGMGWPYTLKMLDAVPGLRLVFDTGNPVFNDDYSKPAPRPRQSAWEFYEHVKAYIVHVHIKDAIWDDATRAPTYTYPGDGEGDVRRIVADLVASGYDGCFSMEPHLQVVFHEDQRPADAQARFDAYVEYGRRFERLLAELNPVQSA